MSIFYCWALVPRGCVVLCFWPAAQPWHVYCTAQLGIHTMLNLVIWQNYTHKIMQFTLNKFIKTVCEIIVYLNCYIGSSPWCVWKLHFPFFLSQITFSEIKLFEVWVEILWKLSFLWKSNRIGVLVHISKLPGTGFSNLTWSLSLDI